MWKTTSELAEAVNQRGLYAKGDGSPVDAVQVHGRTRNYSNLFEREGASVRLPVHDAEWLLSPGESIRRKHLHEMYGGRRQGGIGPSGSTPNSLVFTDPPVGALHGYFDRWEGNVLHYTGEGQHGDQEIVQGNKAIANHVTDGRVLRAFEGSAGEVTYIGEFAVDPVNPWDFSDAPETGGGPIRRVIMFRLLPVGQFWDGVSVREPKDTRPSLGTAYRRVDESTGVDSISPSIPDPEAVDRGLRGHKATQNALADFLSKNGLEPHPWSESVLVAVLGQLALDIDGATHRCSRVVEGDEEAVAGVADHLSVVGFEGGAQCPVVPVQQILPRLVADEADQVGGGDDVGEHERLDHAAPLDGDLGLAQEFRHDDKIRFGAQLLEHGLGGPELEHAAPFVTRRAARLTEQERWPSIMRVFVLDARSRACAGYNPGCAVTPGSGVITRRLP